MVCCWTIIQVMVKYNAGSVSADRFASVPLNFFFLTKFNVYGISTLVAIQYFSVGGNLQGWIWNNHFHEILKSREQV